VENLMVPSAAMGRDIPVTFLGGGPHAVILLDAFNAGDAVSNWVTAGNAMNTLAGKGVSVVAPAGGAYSLYTDWEQDGSKQWETVAVVLSSAVTPAESPNYPGCRIRRARWAGDIGCESGDSGVLFMGTAFCHSTVTQATTGPAVVAAGPWSARGARRGRQRRR
jgi:hypothetical protein